MAKSDRKQEILQAFALMLEDSPGTRITTAGLAGRVGVSEAALYRHFASKAKMIDALIEFAETTIFDNIGRINQQQADPGARCGEIVWLLLLFCDKNPGFARLFSGDALLGETDRLRGRVREIYDRIETELRQVVRTVHQQREAPAPISPQAAANLMLAAAEGRISQFVRSNFRRSPTTDWHNQWAALAAAVL